MHLQAVISALVLHLIVIYEHSVTDGWQQT